MIKFATEKVISVNTQIDGGGLIILDGQGNTRLFFVNAAISLDLSNITVTGGNAEAS